jgi:hypothetical protein
MRTMAGVVLSVLAFGVAASQESQWLRVGANERFALYYDQSTIRHRAEGASAEQSQASVWVGFDLHQQTTLEGGIKVRSLTQRFEYDCAAETWRKAGERFYADARFAGAMIKESNAQAAWAPMPPGSIPDGFFGLVCTAQAGSGAKK